MLDFSHIPTNTGATTVDTFIGYSTVTTLNLQTWVKPRGKTMARILLVGAGGNGGTGVIGANSAAAGGGGGGSGAQTSITIPLWAIPDVLFLQLAAGGSALGSYIAVASGAYFTNTTLIASAAGGNGGNGAAAVGGAAGAAGAAATAASMALGFQWLDSTLIGQAGIIGGAAVAGAALTLPATGLLVTGGTGGGGLPAAATAGTAGGAFTVVGAFPAQVGGAAQATATSPAVSGSHGFSPIAGLTYGYGGTGGGSTHGTATGAGLVQSSGGNGAAGCGGGGMGGALTGSTAGVIGLGGPSYCIITCW
jgi:hypothetical protein